MTKKICILSVIPEHCIDGNLIDCMDLYYNLKNYVHCDYYILTPYNLLKKLYYKLKLTFKQPLYSDIIQHIRPITFKVEFSKYDLFIYRYNYYKFNNDIINYKGILINGESISRELIYYGNKNIYSNFKYVIASPFILNFDNISTHYFIYHLKLSQYRLDNLIYNNKKTCFSDYNQYETLKCNYNFNIHEYDKLIWYRHKREDNIEWYAEIKAKLIFEFLYLNKNVHYLPINKYFDDGLTDYLKLFNIDDNIEQDLNISIDELYEKVIKFNEDDELLHFIEKME